MNRRKFIIGGTTGIIGATAGHAFSMPSSFLLSGSNAGNGPKGPNVLWIMMDDCRYDAIGCYGKSWPVTPHIDKLAAEGVKFDTAIVQNTVSVPSRKSMKTGYYAHEVGPMEMGKAPEIPADYLDRVKMDGINSSPNLLDLWSRAGMEPFNFGKIHGFPKSFIDSGDADVLLDVYGNSTEYFLKKFGADSSILKSERVFTKKHKWQIGGVLDIKPEDTETARLGDWAVDGLKSALEKGDRFFMRASFHAPHVACFVPREYFSDPSKINLPLPSAEELASKPEFEKGPLHTYCEADLTKEQIDLCRGTYYGMVTQVDDQVGRLVEVLENAGKLDNTIIAVTSDQGFQLGEHGLWKKRVFYEANVRVPLIIRYPERLPRGVSIDEPVELVDFLPTLLDLSGIGIPTGIRGASLVPLAKGEVKKWRKACFSEIDHSQSMYDELRQGTGRRVMVRTREWKLDYFMDQRVKDKDGALYNLLLDPDEKDNLYKKPGNSKIIRELEKLAVDWSQGTNMLIK